MREADRSYLWCTKAWFRTKPGTTPRTLLNLTDTRGQKESRIFSRQDCFHSYINFSDPFSFHAMLLQLWHGTINNLFTFFSER